MTQRVVIVGPPSSVTSSLEESLRHRGDAVVVSDDVRHALLLLRVFMPTVLLAPRPLDAESLGLLATSSSRPILMVADVPAADAVRLVLRGVARVIPATSTIRVLSQVLQSPLNRETMFARVVAQAHLSRATGVVRFSATGDFSVDDGHVYVQDGAIVEATTPQLRGQAALQALMDAPVGAVDFVAGEEVLADVVVEEGPGEETFDLTDVDVEASEQLPRVPATAEELAVLPPPRVLIVEDDIDIARLYQLLLKARGCVVELAGDGGEGFLKVRTFQPDLVLTDIMMPRQTGWDLLALIRNDARFRETRVLMFSHHSEMVRQLKDANSGADGYLDKAQKPDVIVSAVMNALTPARDIEAVIMAGAVRSEGNLAAIGPQRLLRLLSRAQATGRLAVRVGAVRYLVSLQQGAIVDAQGSVGDATLHHRDALRGLLLVDDGSFTFVAGSAPATAPATPLAPLLDDLSREIERLLEDARGTALSDGRTLQVRQDLLRIYRANCPEAAHPLVDLIARTGSPRELLLNADVDPVFADALVRDLFRKGVMVPAS